MKIAVNQYLLLISETALLTAVRTSPGNSVAGHAPQIICHALLTYLKTTTTGPAEGKFLSADVAVIIFLLSPSMLRSASYDLRFHGRLCFCKADGLHHCLKRNTFLKTLVIYNTEQQNVHVCFWSDKVEAISRK
jgi:hypothetical protein